MKIALIDSGLGLLAAAAAVRRVRPDVSLVLSGDPDGMPWGPRDPRDIAERALRCARAARAHGPRALVVACNTASVHALDALRAEFEPTVPVIGTVPAVKPGALAGGPLAIWATPATTGSAYQRRLIAEFADGVETAEVPCHGLADAVERADSAAIIRAVDAAVRLTPPGVRDVVLGCTHYELVADSIRERLGEALGAPVRLHGSAGAVAAQALRRAGVTGDGASVAPPGARGVGDLVVLASGRLSRLSPAALEYPEAALLLGPGRPVSVPVAGSGEDEPGAREETAVA
ncbi:aspartate/glutamate racemase family protein [Streptomyces calidiresistens]|uniref:Glutamate racemase n=1 Tax=Streptomyces calidiresistens TaxID=1485586 RepID=A0A7W3T5A1_9ACTN|nr:aspartate/glutamate racemase family protein [Streptomyces calidiresistens]MBB0231167.1 glutamate racemase [Streptomyces calidiresistens]